MSLLHRVGSNENTARRSSGAQVTGSSPSQVHGRRLSFNPVGEWIRPDAIEEPVAAYEVPKFKRLAQVLVAVVYCLFAAGIVFGYAALKPVLIQERVYRDQCTEEELEKKVDVCYGQELRLNFMFTVAAVATNVFALPIGTILDRYGPRVCGIISSIFLALGCLFFAFASDMKPAFDGYITGYVLLAIGGPFVFISSFQLSNSFPRYSGLILAVLTGAFDTSSAIFLIYRLIYTASEGTLWPKKFFLVYLIVPAFILIVQVVLMPSKSYKTVGELLANVEDESDESQDNHANVHDPTALERLGNARRERRESAMSEITSLLGNKDSESYNKAEAAKQTRSGVYGALHGRSAKQQVLTPWWGLAAAFTLIQMLRINYFVATVRPQYTYLLGSTGKGVQINSCFDIMLPLGGVLSVPFIGFVLDNLPTTFVLSMLVVFATVIGILGVLPYMWAAYLNVILFCLYRPFYYTTISDYCAKVFGFDTFGKVYGLIICLAGLFNFMQSPLDALTHRKFNNDPRPINIILLCVGFAIGVVLVAYVGYQSRSIDRQRLEDEAEGARVSLMPGADQRVLEDHHPVPVHQCDGANGQQPH